MLATLLIAGAALVAGSGESARDRLPGRQRRVIDPARVRRTVSRLVGGPVWRTALVAAAPAATLAGLNAGPVAGAVAAVYTAVIVHEWRRRAARKQAATDRAAGLDELSTLVADLRAGIPAAVLAAGRSGPDVTGSDVTRSVSSGSGRLGRLTEAVWSLAERTGAPAADLLERIEADARSADRSAKTAAAQASGAQTTALLLAALPLAGIALGHGIGADPLGVLFGTPLGAAALTVAVLLQCAGLKWAQRLSERVVP
jgi:tight adherence protein B